MIDSLYGDIEIYETAWKFINTPEFQRLKNIQQLGNVRDVLHIGGHTRYEHCIGTMHISGKMFEFIIKNTIKSYKNVANYYGLKICVELAGLLHDIGHGPKSHVFQEAIKYKGSNVKFDHELNSINLIEQINNRENIIDKSMVDLVCAMIIGDKIKGYPNFIFEIVANKKSGLDTDKLDYLNRDSFYINKSLGYTKYPLLNIENIFTHVKLNKMRNLVYPEEIANDISLIFMRRKKLFEDIYYHPEVTLYDRAMICCILKVINDQNSINEIAKMTDDELNNILKLCDGCIKFGTTNTIKKCNLCENIILDRTPRLSGDTYLNPLTLIRFIKKK
jgi:deoxynucleoside triphosphate triphosphohydrolase SAMHD1